MLAGGSQEWVFLFKASRNAYGWVGCLKMVTLLGWAVVGSSEMRKYCEVEIVKSVLHGMACEISLKFTILTQPNSFLLPSGVHCSSCVCLSSPDVEHPTRGLYLSNLKQERINHITSTNFVQTLRK